MAVGTVAMLYRWAGYCSVILPTAVPHTGSLGHRLLYGTNSPDSGHSTPLADTVHTIFTLSPPPAIGLIRILLVTIILIIWF